MVLAAVLPLLLAACAAGATPQPSLRAASLPTTPPASTEAVHYPLTLTDDEGTSVSIPAAPQHIVSLSPANTEIVFALGGGSRMVGGTDADDYPAAAATLPHVVTSGSVLFEKIAALSPDLVLAAGNGFTPDSAITRLRQLGYPVVVLYGKTVDGVVADIRTVGRALGLPAAGDALAAGLRSRMGSITSAVAALSARPKVFYEIGYGPDIYGPAPDSFLADLITKAGGTPITTSDPNVFSIPLEQLLTANPDVILLGDALYGTCPSDIASRAGWSAIAAVKNGAVRPVNDTVITRPGPRLDQGLSSLARAIHPGLALPDEPADPPMCTASAPSPGSAAASANASPAP